MLRTFRFHDGALHVSTNLAEGAPPSHEGTLWIHAAEPDEAEMEALATRFDLHAVSVRDALRVGAPPKLVDYGEYLFFVIHSPVRQGDAKTRKIAIFLHTDWVITVHLFPLALMEELETRTQDAPSHLLDSPHRLALALLDHVTTGFEHKAERMLQAVSALEGRVLDNPGRDALTDILRVRRELVAWERLVRAQRDVCLFLCRTGHSAIPRDDMPWFRDVHDHLLRVYDLFEGGRGDLTAVRDAYLSVTNNNLSEVMRALTVIATIMMPLSLLAGIYGMNFEWMPGMRSPLGFWIMLGAMVLMGGGMLFSFKKRGWF